MKLKSHAKVNLFLHVGKKRADGYHELHTLFERLDLHDDVTLSVRKDGKLVVRCTDRSIPTDERNTALKAARFLKEATGTRQGALIHIRKRVPTQAGLGGGSSNAAAALVGLNRLWKTGLPAKKLLKIGARVGSDVPFFLLDAPFAVGRGRGERLKKVNFNGKFWHVLVKPPFGISTKEAYSALGERRLTPPNPNVMMLLRSILKGHSSTLAKDLFNSLEESLNNRVMTIGMVKRELLRRGAFASLLSGSGSTVFGLFKSRRAAVSAARGWAGKKGWKTFVARTA